MSPTLYKVGQFKQRAISIIPWFILCMYYLSVCNRSGLFKSKYCYVLFLLFEKFIKYYEKYF